MSPLFRTTISTSYDTDGSVISKLTSVSNATGTSITTDDNGDGIQSITLFTSTACGRGRRSGAKASMRRVRDREDVVARSIAA